MLNTTSQLRLKQSWIKSQTAKWTGEALLKQFWIHDFAVAIEEAMTLSVPDVTEDIRQ